MATTIDFLATLDDARFLGIYEALSEQGFGPLDHEVAKAMKFRPHAIRKLPMPQRAKKARTILTGTRNAEMCYELLGSYLMKAHKELIIEFLDATGVDHEDGLIEGENIVPDDAKLDAAIEALDAKHPADEVTMYLALSAQTWPEVPRFEELWQARVK